MFFETKDLYTKKLTIEDAKRFHQVCTQPYILKWMDDWDMDYEHVEKLVTHFANGYEVNDPEKHPYIMGIWHKADQQFIGICGFGPKYELGEKTEIAYFIDEQYANRGYMTQIVSKAIPFIFAQFDKPYLSALVHQDNFISRRIVLKHQFSLYPENISEGFLEPHYRLYR